MLVNQHFSCGDRVPLTALWYLVMILSPARLQYVSVLHLDVFQTPSSSSQSLGPSIHPGKEVPGS